MKKKILALLCALLLTSAAVCFADEADSGNAVIQQTYAGEAINIAGESAPDTGQAPVLHDVSYTVQGSRQLIVKLYDVPPGYDATRLAQQDFEDGGLLYTHKETIKVSDNRTLETKQASQTVTVSHEEQDGALACLQPMLEYDQDGYTGQLLLQTDSITTAEAGSESYGYTVSDTREYTPCATPS